MNFEQMIEDAYFKYDEYIRFIDEIYFYIKDQKECSPLSTLKKDGDYLLQTLLLSISVADGKLTHGEYQFLEKITKNQDMLLLLAQKERNQELCWKNLEHISSTELSILAKQMIEFSQFYREDFVDACVQADLQYPEKELLNKLNTILSDICVSFCNIDGVCTEQEQRYVLSGTTYLVSKPWATIKKKRIENERISKQEILEKDHKNPSVQKLLEELEQLPGLDEVKKDVISLTHLIQIQQLRKRRGLHTTAISRHLVFSGNPGTGKTTVARLLGKLYKEMGALSKGQFVEVDRSGLVGSHIGQTALKTMEKVNEAMGGVLFIDEAYTLTFNKGENDFGQEAVDTLLKAMEDHRDDIVVIVAGYPDLMLEFLKSNPGLKSRFNKYINFSDYDAKQLTAIYNLICDKEGYKNTDEAFAYAKQYFEKIDQDREENFANGRFVRNFFEQVIQSQANRLSQIDDYLSNDDLITLTIEDLKESCN